MDGCSPTGAEHFVGTVKIKGFGRNYPVDGGAAMTWCCRTIALKHGAILKDRALQYGAISSCGDCEGRVLTCIQPRATLAGRVQSVTYKKIYYQMR